MHVAALSSASASMSGSINWCGALHQLWLIASLQLPTPAQSAQSIGGIIAGGFPPNHSLPTSTTFKEFRNVSNPTLYDLRRDREALRLAHLSTCILSSCKRSVSTTFTSLWRLAHQVDNKGLHRTYILLKSY